ncbi:MAG: UxaA family hydrolase, partial [Brevundimonas sp.]
FEGYRNKDGSVGTRNILAITTTVQCVAGVVAQAVARIKAEWGKPMTVIGTGGVVSLFEGATDSIDRFDPDLTIRGLLEIWRRNPHIGRT